LHYAYSLNSFISQKHANIQNVLLVITRSILVGYQAPDERHLFCFDVSERIKYQNSILQGCRLFFIKKHV